MPVEEALAPYVSLVDQRLDELLPAESEAPEALHAAMRYSALATGKRIRPALCMAAAQAVGAEAEFALDAGCALELIHCFSLIHDDLPAIDNDDLRRGRPTLHVAHGEAMAILAGDALFNLSFAVLADLESPPAVIVEVIRRVSRATGTLGLVGGEVMDILAEGTEPNLEVLQEIHRRKTGSLIQAACAIGALVGGGSPQQVNALEAYGMHLGLAFQIADDILNEISTPEALGKATGSDRELGKMTYPALMGLEGAKREANRQVTAARQALVDAGLTSPFLEFLASYTVERGR